MKAKDLKEFSFVIGNDENGNDVIATNNGIFVEGELVAKYNEDWELEDYGDLCELIDDAIWRCDKLHAEDENDIPSCFYGADIDIEEWWSY